MYLCARSCVHGRTWMHWTERPEEGIWSFGPVVSGRCTPTDIGSGIWTQVPCKSRMCSSILSHFSSSSISFSRVRERRPQAFPTSFHTSLQYQAHPEQWTTDPGGEAQGKYFIKLLSTHTSHWAKSVVSWLNAVRRKAHFASTLRCAGCKMVNLMRTV